MDAEERNAAVDREDDVIRGTAAHELHAVDAHARMPSPDDTERGLVGELLADLVWDFGAPTDLWHRRRRCQLCRLCRRRCGGEEGDEGQRESIGSVHECLACE